MGPVISLRRLHTLLYIIDLQQALKGCKDGRYVSARINDDHTAVVIDVVGDCTLSGAFGLFISAKRMGERRRGGRRRKTLISLCLFVESTLCDKIINLVMTVAPV